MFDTFQDVQKLQIQHGAALLREARLSVHFFGRGMELQILRDGKRELSISSNSAPFIHSLRNQGKLEVTLGFGSITRGKQTLRVGLGGEFQWIAADEDINGLVLPEITFPTLAIFIAKPASAENAVIGLQIWERSPVREVTIDIDEPQKFDRQAFTEFCHRQLSIPKKS